MFGRLVRVCGALLLAWGLLVVSSPTGSLRAQPPTEQAWMTDAQGREYRLEPLPKAQGVKIGDDRIRTIWGVVADLGKEDASTYYIKVYRVAPVAPAAPPAPTAPVDGPEDLPAVVTRVAFEPFGTGLPTAGQWREGLAVADVAGDGRLDILAAGPRKTMRPPVVFTREGDAWTRAAITFPSRPYDYGDLAVAPASGAAPTTIALGVHLRGLMAMGLTRPGVFEDASQGLPFVARADDAVFSSRAIALADCNGDGRHDIIALGEGPRLGARGASALAGLGVSSFVRGADGAWTRKALTDSEAMHGDGLATGDVDGDGRVDVAVAPAMLGDTRVVLRGDGACGWTVERVEAIRPRSFVTAVTLADLDGDGRAELVAGTTRFEGSQAWGHLDVYRRAPSGAWTRQPLARLDGRARFEAITTGDLDGDRRIDIAAVGPDGETFVFLGEGKGRFVRERVTIPAPARCGGSAIVAADFDADGRADLVIAHAQERSATADPAACPSEGALTAWRSVAPRPAPRPPAAD